MTGQRSMPRPVTGGSLLRSVADNHDLYQRPPERKVAGVFPGQATLVMLYQINLLAAQSDESLRLVLKPPRVFLVLSTAIASRAMRRELSIHGLG